MLPLIDDLFSAVANDDVATVERLITADPRLVQARKEFSGEPLHEARSGAMIRLLLRRGADVNAAGWLGATPLHEAADRGDVEGVRALIAGGAAAGRRSEAGFLPLHRAAAGEVVQALLHADGTVLEAVDTHGRTPLHFAAQFGRESAVEALLQSGAEVDARTAWGQTPLYLAAQEGHLGIVRLLLRSGAVVDAVDSAFGQTPLHAAAFRGHTAVLEALLEAGADTSTRNRAGQLPYHCARDNSQTEAAALLRSRTPDQELGLTQEVQSTPLPCPHRCLRLHPEGQRALSLADGGRVALWSLEREPQMRLWVQTNSARLYDAAVHPGGELVAVAGDGRGIEIRTWDLILVHEIELPDNAAAAALDFSPCGRYLAVATDDEQMHQLELASGRVLSTVEAGEWTASVRYSPDGRLLAAACSFQGGGVVNVYTVDQGRSTLLYEFSRSDVDTPEDTFVDSLASLAFSPDSRALMLYETSRISRFREGAWHGNVATLDIINGGVLWLVPLNAELTDDSRTLVEAGMPDGFYTEAACGSGWAAVGTSLGKVLFFDLADGALRRSVELDSQEPVVSLQWNAARGHLWTLTSAADGSPVNRVEIPSGK